MPSPKTPTPRVGKALGAILSGARMPANVPNDVSPDATPMAPAFEPLQIAPSETPIQEPAAHAVSPAASSTMPHDAPPAAVSARHLSIEPRQAAAAPAVTEGKGGARKRETFLIDAELADEMRDAIVHLQGPPLFLNLATFGEEAIRAYLGTLKGEYMNGASFPKRPHAVRQGRPLR